jgi:hypothetical protein
VAAAMRAKLQTAEGHAHYARRKAIVEPVFGQIKEARGFRRFSFRGVVKVTAEWALICLTHYADLQIMPIPGGHARREAEFALKGAA